MAEAMLSTIDNPFNPFDNFDEWMAYDEMLARKQGRPTCCGYLARMSMMSMDLSDKELEDLNEMTIDEICRLNLTGTFVKVLKDEEKNEKEPGI